MGKRNFRRLLMAVALVLPALETAVAQNPVARPRLVVGIVVDQMRWDYLYYYGSHYAPDGGINRLLREGFSCANTQIDYVPTVTACGHASLYTGTTPAVHGIAGNNFEVQGRQVASVDDPSVQSVGTTSDAGRRSPRNLLSTTIGDELKAAIGFNSKVVGIAIKDRAAVLPAGHAADGAYWFDKSVPAFVTSSYYMERLPEWMQRFNSSQRKLLSQNLSLSWRGVTATFLAAQAAVDGEKLGQRDGCTDMLAISVSTTDQTAHEFGTRSAIVDSCYWELDRQLASFFSMLDASVGQGQYLVFLSADHGGTNSAAYNTSHRLPTGAWLCWDKEKPFNDWMKARFGQGGLVKWINQFNVYINEDSIAAAHLNRAEVMQAACQWLEQFPEVDRAVCIEKCLTEPMPAELRERLVRGYYPGRSGQIFAILKPGGYAGDARKAGSSHGTPGMDDSHIPLVFMGWGVKHGETFAETHITDMAPTVCALLHIQMPSGAIGHPILQVLGED